MLQAIRGSRVALLALSLVGSIGCKSDTSVDAYIDQAVQEICDSVIACNCEYPNGALLEHCLGQLSVNYDSAAQLNLVEGLSFDGDCADEALTQIKDVGCGVLVGDPEAKCEAPCKIWYGPVSKGGTCASVNGFDNCKQGLTCGADSVCVNPCAKPDVPGIGEVCGSLLGCVEGAYCDINAGLTPVCQALPTASQPCTKPEGLCAEGLFCDNVTAPDAPVCTPLPALDEECTFQCAANLYCDTTKTPSVCAAVPTLGQECPLGGCQAPYVCNGEGICEDPPPPICGAYQGLPIEDCAADEFTCDNGACIADSAACDMATDCSDGSDEAPINPNCEPPAGCGVEEIECVDGTCIGAFQLCDGSIDCIDGFDEGPDFCP